MLCLRFDDKSTWDQRRKTDKFAPISDIRENIDTNSKRYYKPHEYMTIDEQLVVYRGRCPFRVYIYSTNMEKK